MITHIQMYYKGRQAVAYQTCSQTQKRFCSCGSKAPLVSLSPGPLYLSVALSTTGTRDMGGARGGLEGAIAPLSEYASPPSEGEKLFCRRFLTFAIP